MNKTICFLFNQAPRYVESAYALFDKELPAKWCFGSNDTDIVDMDFALLKDVKIYKTKRMKGGFYCLSGSCEIAKNKTIGTYILIGEPKLINTWVLPLMIRYYNKGASIFYWSHGWYGKESQLKAFIKRIYFQLADGVFTYGNYARELMIKEGFSPEKIFAIHNSLHHNKQVAIRNSIPSSHIFKKHFDNSYPTIIFIGRLTKVKKLDMIIAALSKLKQKGENYNLIFVGDGTERASLRNLVLTNNLEEQVWFYGACYEEEKNAELIYNADLCVSPGNVGLTAMHALVFGCPVITHDNYPWQMPEFESIKEGITGSFFKYDSVESLAETITKWFSTHEGKRKEVRDACQKEIDSYWTPEYELKILKQALGIE